MSGSALVKSSWCKNVDICNVCLTTDADADFNAHFLLMCCLTSFVQRGLLTPSMGLGQWSRESSLLRVKRNYMLNIFCIVINNLQINQPTQIFSWMAIYHTVNVIFLLYFDSSIWSEKNKTIIFPDLVWEFFLIGTRTCWPDLTCWKLN